MEGEEEGCKTKQKCEEITLFGESGNQITSAMHEENLIKNGNHSVNKRLSQKGKVEVKEKGKGKTRPAVKRHNVNNLNDRSHHDDQSNPN